MHLLPYRCLCEDLARIGVEPYLSPLSVNLIEPGLKATGRITLFPCNKPSTMSIDIYYNIDR